MKLTLTDDDGVVLEQWYMPGNDLTPTQCRAMIEGKIEVYTDKEEYEELSKEQ